MDAAAPPPGRRRRRRARAARGPTPLPELQTCRASRLLLPLGAPQCRGAAARLAGVLGSCIAGLLPDPALLPGSRHHGREAAPNCRLHLDTAGQHPSTTEWREEIDVGRPDRVGACRLGRTPACAPQPSQLIFFSLCLDAKLLPLSAQTRVCDYKSRAYTHWHFCHAQKGPSLLLGCLPQLWQA